MGVLGGLKQMNAVIIDSGVSKEIVSNIYAGFSVIKNKQDYSVISACEDEVGHGTAVAQIFFQNIEHIESLKVYIIKLSSESGYSYDIESLLFALDFIERNILCDLLIISSGLRIYNNLLYGKLSRLHERGTIIFSSFDNEGSMSYPAAFECVIGVDISSDLEAKNDSCIGLINNPINIVVPNKLYKVKWINGRNNIVKGSSFACADIAGKFANYCISKNDNNNYFDFMKKSSTQLINCKKENNHKNGIYRCNKAVVFPFNKEIHSIALNEDLINIQIEDYYDIRQSGKVNIEIRNILHGSDNKKTIKNIDTLDWESDFDTFILGHCAKYERMISYDIKDNIIENCVKHKKFVISFDDLEKYHLDSSNAYYPYIDHRDVPYCNYGKMYLTNIPVLGIFGTSSKQGKYTLQLMLRRLFINDGYSVAQIGTEPTSILFGMDYVFPMGYNSTVRTKSNDNIMILNKFIHGCEEKSPDIIIVGSQSGTCPYNIYNLKLFTLPQIEFLLGTQPDLVVLSVNVCDNLEYISRTIKTIEGIVDCKVIAIVLFPRKVSERVEMISSLIADEQYQEYKQSLVQLFNVPAFSLEVSEIKLLYKYIIDYLS